MKNGDIASEENGKSGSKWRKLITENKLVAFLIFCVIIAIIIGLLQIFVFLNIFVEKERNFRLPTNLIPSHYSLEIKPYIIPGNFKFEGKEEITVTCVEGTDEVVLHSDGLEINEDEVKVQNVKSKSDVKVLRIKHDEKNQFLVFQLLENLKENEMYRINIAFQGVMKKDEDGFYVSSYEDSRNITRYTASTQFDLVYAREAFPCFDEPAMKATFDITVVRWKNMTSLSNMNISRIEPRGRDWEADVYQTSPKMSTYLVAFCIGDYVGKRSGKIRIWSSPDQANFTGFALENSVKFLQFYENLLQSYELPKLDFVTVRTLEVGTTKTWGLIITPYLYLLYDDDRKVTSNKEDILSSIAFEIAQQWFGNLVTPKWWSDIWLSAGLATYLEYISTKTLFPQLYQIDQSLLLMYRIIRHDCKAHETLHRNIESKGSILDIFDMIIYEKGAAVIRMAHNILGSDTFWKGIRGTSDKGSTWTGPAQRTVHSAPGGQGAATVGLNNKEYQEMAERRLAMLYTEDLEHFELPENQTAHDEFEIITNRWCRQPFDDYEISLYEHDMRYLDWLRPKIEEEEFELPKEQTIQEAIENMERMWSRQPRDEVELSEYQKDMRYGSWLRDRLSTLAEGRQIEKSWEIYLWQVTRSSNPIYRENIKLLYMDTDAYIYDIKTDDGEDYELGPAKRNQRSSLECTNFVRTYKYKSVEEKNLWECLTKAQYRGIHPKENFINLTEVMTTWTHNKGLPIITVKRDYDMQTVTFSQEPCSPENTEDSKNDVWHVPLSYTTVKERDWNAKVSIWLTERSVTIKDMPNEKEWILVDAQAMGYYLVNYDRTNWNLLATQLQKEHEIFPPEQRMKILADANILEMMDYVTIDTLLDLSLYLPKEKNLFMFSDVTLYFIGRNWEMAEESYYEDWKEYLIYLFEPTYKTVGWEDDDENSITRMFQLTMFGILCLYDYPPCLDEAVQEYHHWTLTVENGTRYFEMKSEYLLCAAIKHGNKSKWEYMYNVFLNTSYSELLEPLACSTDVNLIKKLLQLTFERNKREYMILIRKLSHSTHWAQFLIYLNEHFDEIANNEEVFNHVINALEFFNGRVKHEQVLATCKKFLKRLSGSKKEALQQVLERMEKNLATFMKNKVIIEKWLDRKPWQKQK